MVNKIKDLFNLHKRVAVITGGAGMLGVMHAQVIAEAGGNPVLVDIDANKAKKEAEVISKKYKVACLSIKADITNKNEVEAMLSAMLKKFGRVDILINNAAHDPKVKRESAVFELSRFENFTLGQWNKDIAVGLTGAFLCSQAIGIEMAKRKKGVILNISSDLGIIAPDQRIYRRKNISEDQQPVKPVSYSVVKTGLIGLTKYLATYWADKGIRVNALCPGGIYNNQSDDFVKKLTNLIPLRRMANRDEYKGAVLFLVSDASSYMTGATMVIDGGRTCW